MKAVIILKVNKDHSVGKGWHPIILHNTFGKLVETQGAKKMQKNTCLFHHLQYGSRTRLSSTDPLLLIVVVAERADQSVLQVTLLETDIV